MDTRGVYETPLDALRAGAEAAAARIHAIQRHQEPPGWAVWVDRDFANMIADGLRLTGFRVSVSWRYTAAVVIRDEVPAHSHWLLGEADCECGATMLDELARGAAFR